MTKILAIPRLSDTKTAFSDENARILVLGRDRTAGEMPGRPGVSSGPIGRWGVSFDLTGRRATDPS